MSNGKVKTNKANSFKLFWDAVKGSGPDIWVSLQVIIVITLVLAVIFYFSEHRAQPEEYGFWQSLLWAFSRYIGDPGKFAQVAPVTIGGRLIAMCIGILGILIFAIPAGVIGARFRKAIDDDKRERQLAEYAGRMQKTFKPSQNAHTKFQVVPRYHSLGWLQARLGLSEADIIDTIRHTPNLRLRNMASTYNPTEDPQDRLVAESISLEGRTSYGCCINRGSKVTIVSTSSISDTSADYTAYYIARMGGFNYISKEFEPIPESAVSFYVIPDGAIEDEMAEKRAYDEKKKKSDPEFKTPLNDFMNDLRSFCGGDDHWVIFILGTSRLSKTNFHFRHMIAASQHEALQLNTSVMQENEPTFMALYREVEQMLANNDYPFSGDLENYVELKAGLDDVFPSFGGKKNPAVKLLKQGCKLNAFAITIQYRIMARDNRIIPLCYRLAQVFAKHLEGREVKAVTGKGVNENDDWKKKKALDYGPIADYERNIQ